MIVGLTATSPMCPRVAGAAWLIFSFTVGFVSTARAAEHERQPIRCGECPSIRDVMLLVGPMPEGARQKTATRAWISETRAAARGKMPAIARSVADAGDFRHLVQALADSCLRVKFLGILGHGSIGYLQLGHEGVSLENMTSVFGNGMHCAMSPDASIAIVACNVGRGYRGARFLLGMAGELLQKGGVVRAPQDYVFGNALFGAAPRPLRGGYRELRVDPRAGHPPGGP